MKKSSFKVGDNVSWVCRPGIRNGVSLKPFTCEGAITALAKGKLKGATFPVASLNVFTLKYKKTFGKKVTIIKIAKLSLVK